MNQDTTYNWNPEYTAECDIQNGLADEQARAEAEESESVKDIKSLIKEINKKVIIIHGRPDSVLIPCYLWEEISHQLNKLINILGEK